MSIISKLFGVGDAAKVVPDAVTAVGNAFDQLFTSDEERQAGQIVLERLRQAPHILQGEVTKIEAQHRSVFVAGWRPFIGWVCGSGLAFTFVINPVIQWSTGQAGPAMPTEAMTSMVVTLLGLGGLRTYEKLQGKTK